MPEVEDAPGWRHRNFRSRHILAVRGLRMHDTLREGQLVERPPIFFGWYIVLACGAVAFYSWGLGFYGQGVYLPALHTLHGWPTSLMSAAITC